jgi:NAD(P)-dependent dehydrogenase (short-subunit alcohol dehydrogenase family)
LADSLAGSPGKLHPIKCDISKEEDILNAFSGVKEKLGGVDILVNNAGVVHETLLSGTSPTAASEAKKLHTIFSCESFLAIVIEIHLILLDFITKIISCEE